MELSAVRQYCEVTFLYRDWNCMQYLNIATLRVFTGNGTVRITVTLQRYMFVKGIELFSLR